jgi:hypothetical protein
MTYPISTPGPLALSVALALIKALGNPALRHGANPITAGELAEIIQGEMNITVIRKAINEALAEIEYHHAYMLAEEERNHPRGSGWARVYDKLVSARDLLKGRAA